MSKKCEVAACGITETQLPVDCQLVPFPDVKDRRQPLWVEFVKGKGSTWRPHATSCVCTMHFESNQFFNNKRTSRLLKGAVPTLKKYNNQHERRAALLSCNQVQIPRAGYYNTIDETSPLCAAARPIYPQPPIQPRSQAKINGSSVTRVVDYMNTEEEERLNKVQLKKSVRGLIVHVDGLIKNCENDPIKEMEFQCMRYILQKVLLNISLSPEEALKMFQNQVEEKYYNHLRRLVKVERRHFKALVRSFSLSLHFYSQPGYSFIRQKLRGALPHPRTIQAWYTEIDKYMLLS